MTHASRSGLHAIHVESQTVKLALVHAVDTRLAHIRGIGLGDDFRIGVERVGDGEQNGILRVGGGAGKCGLRFGRGIGARAYLIENLWEFHASQPTPCHAQQWQAAQTPATGAHRRHAENGQRARAAYGCR